MKLETVEKSVLIDLWEFFFYILKFLMAAI